MEAREGNVDESFVDTSLPTDVSLSQDDASEMEDVLKSNEHFCATKIKNTGIFTSSRFSRKYESGDDARLFRDQKLKNELLKMNIQLKEKSLKMDSLKAENFQKIENLESKLSESRRENGLLKMQINIEKEDMESMKADLIKKLKNIESNQGYLKIASTEIQRLVEAPCITEQQHQQLLETPNHKLPLIDFISKHLFERQRDTMEVIEATRSSLKVKQDQLHAMKLSLDQLNDDLDKDKQARVELEVKLERSVKVVKDLRSKIVLDDFKSNNYDAVNKKKDELEMKSADVTMQKDLLDNQLSSVSKQLSEYQNEVSLMRQCNVLLTADKTYLSQALQELNGKVTYLEGRCHYLDVQNDKYKGAREELYEKYIASRDQYNRDYDERLRTELDRMSKQMEEDIERVKQANREVSEREIRSLREARDMALAEKKIGQASEKQLMSKYEQLLLDFRQKQMWSEGRAGDLQNDLKVRSFEQQKLQVLLEETMSSLKESQLSYDKLQKKMDVLMKEYYSMQVVLERRNSELQVLVNLKDSNTLGGVNDIEELALLKKKTSELESERNTLLMEKKLMASDLKKLLNQNEEMSELKRMIETVKKKGVAGKTNPLKNTTKPPSRITFKAPNS